MQTKQTEEDSRQLTPSTLLPFHSILVTRKLLAARHVSHRSRAPGPFKRERERERERDEEDFGPPSEGVRSDIVQIPTFESRHECQH